MSSSWKYICCSMERQERVTFPGYFLLRCFLGNKRRTISSWKVAGFNQISRRTGRRKPRDQFEGDCEAALNLHRGACLPPLPPRVAAPLSMDDPPWPYAIRQSTLQRLVSLAPAMPDPRSVQRKLAATRESNQTARMGLRRQLNDMDLTDQKPYLGFTT